MGAGSSVWTSPDWASAGSLTKSKSYLSFAYSKINKYRARPPSFHGHDGELQIWLGSDLEPITKRATGLIQSGPPPQSSPPTTRDNQRRDTVTRGTNQRVWTVLRYDLFMVYILIDRR